MTSSASSPSAAQGNHAGKQTPSSANASGSESNAAVTVKTAMGTFAVHPAGAHVTRWDSAEHGPIIFTSAHTAYEVGTAIRGGIPLCFPWFGAGRTGNQKPSHGFARTTLWREVNNHESEDGVWEITFELDPSDLSEPDAATFPHAFVARYSARFTATTLTVQLQITNSGTDEFSYEEALHTYFAVADITEVEVRGLEAANYFDKADRSTSGVCEATKLPISFTGETDRVYESSASVTIADSANGQIITVAQENSANTVVWNPWAELAAGMKDLGNSEWRNFVCVETANVGDNAVHLEPGESHTMTAVYTVSAGA